MKFIELHKLRIHTKTYEKKTGFFKKEYEADTWKENIGIVCLKQEDVKEVHEFIHKSIRHSEIITDNSIYIVTETPEEIIKMINDKGGE